MNGTGKVEGISAETVPQETGKRKDRHELRREREAWALSIIKDMKKSPSAPEPMAAPFQPTHLSGNPDAPGFVYFAYCAGRIKIGYSTDVPNRMINFTTHAPFEVVLLLTIRGAPEDEAVYHEMFAADRRHLEWFHLSWNMRAFLDEHCENDAEQLLLGAELEFYEVTKEALAYVSEVKREIA